MLRENLIPTPLIRRSEKPRLGVVDIGRPDWFLGLASLRHLIRFLWLLIRMRRQRISAEEKAKQVRDFIQARGGLWIKMGQLIATRRELLADAYCDELETLQDRVDGFPAEHARQTIETELGRTIDEVFTEFISHPVAAASVSQIHRARLKRENVWVAVKVLRPNVAEIFKRDLNLIRSIARLFDRMAVLPYMRWLDMYDELHAMLTEETDLRIEAGSMVGMRRSLRRHHETYVPAVFLAYCSRQVLVMEWVDGVSMSDYLNVLQSDPAKLEAWRRANNVDPSKLAQNMFITVQRQMYEDNLFHGDLHPGNIMLLRDNRIALIDFGSVGTLDSGLRRRIMLHNRLINEGEITRAMAVFLSFSSPLPNIDLDALIRELVRNYKLASKVTSSPAFSDKEKARNSLVTQQSRILRKYNIPASWDFLRISRTSITLEVSLRSLDPELNYHRLWRSYLRQRDHREHLRRARNFSEDAWRAFTSIRELKSELAEESVARQDVRGLVSMKTTSARREIFHMLQGLFSLLVLLLLVVFVGQHHAAILPAIVQKWLEDVTGWFPTISYAAWIVLGLVLLYFRHTLARLASGFRDR